VVGTSEAGLLLAEGRWQDALDAADALHAYCDRIPDPARFWWRSLRARALAGLGRPEEAIGAVRDEVEESRAFGAPGALGRSLRVLGTIDPDSGLDALEEAVAVLDGTPPRLELAKALTAHGAALRRDRRPTEAREPLRRAVELAGECGATPLAEQARAELHAAGARPRTVALAGPAALTPSERRVAELAVDGGTNREIAQTLYVTPKTVEVHLSNAYRKLGIRSRRELAASLAV
jgi:DNA-binding NarL/FixJ family response regulator